MRRWACVVSLSRSLAAALAAVKTGPARSRPGAAGAPRAGLAVLAASSTLGLGLAPGRLPAGPPADGGAEMRSPGVPELVAALLEDTPLEEDLRELTDRIGGRPTGSAANRAAVAWALDRFRQAGVNVRAEPFSLPRAWLERAAAAEITGDGVSFSAAIAAMPFSPGTPLEGRAGPLVDAGTGDEATFAELGDTAAGRFLLIETEMLEDVEGLFREYAAAAAIEARAKAAGAAGLVYMGSRPRSSLYRHIAAEGAGNSLPMVVMGRDDASRCLRLLHAGIALEIRLRLDIADGPAYEADNVIGEIPGSARPEEFVVIGAHLDSWGLGTGALDNGCNVALVIDVARQMRRLGIRPRRTVRFALFNGEEQGLHGSWGYVRSHADELDRHVMASSYDLGSGRISGYFTGGRPEVLRALETALEPVAGLGPFAGIDIPIVGTDNFDFMMEGIGNLVANQEPSNYGPNYHASTDTYDKVDLRQLRVNAAVAAAVTLGFAELDVDWRRQTREEIQALVDSTDLGEQMASFGLLEMWNRRARGRTD